jgi:hypothetical protein
VPEGGPAPRRKRFLRHREGARSDAGYRRLTAAHRAAGLAGPTRRYLFIVGLLAGTSSLPILAAITAGSATEGGYLPPAGTSPFVAPPSGGRYVVVPLPPTLPAAEAAPGAGDLGPRPPEPTRVPRSELGPAPELDSASGPTPTAYPSPTAAPAPAPAPAPGPASVSPPAADEASAERSNPRSQGRHDAGVWHDRRRKYLLVVLDDLRDFYDATDTSEEMKAALESGAAHWETETLEDPMVGTSLRLPRSVLEAVRAEASARHLPTTTLIRAWIIEALGQSAQAPAPAADQLGREVRQLRQEVRALAALVQPRAASEGKIVMQGRAATRVKQARSGRGTSATKSASSAKGKREQIGAKSGSTNRQGKK